MASNVWFPSLIKAFLLKIKIVQLMIDKYIRLLQRTLTNRGWLWGRIRTSAAALSIIVDKKSPWKGLVYEAAVVGRAPYRRGSFSISTGLAASSLNPQQGASSPVEQLQTSGEFGHNTSAIGQIQASEEAIRSLDADDRARTDRQVKRNVAAVLLRAVRYLVRTGNIQLDSSEDVSIRDQVRFYAIATRDKNISDKGIRGKALAAGHRKVIMDVNTGDGLALIAKAKGDASSYYVGTDTDREKVRHAQRRSQRVKNVKFIQLDASSLPSNLGDKLGIQQFDEVLINYSSFGYEGDDAGWNHYGLGKVIESAITR